MNSQRHVVNRLGVACVLACVLGLAMLAMEAEATSWARTFGGPIDEFPWDIRPTADGGWVVIGSTEGSFGAGRTDLWVLKLSAAGEIEWQAAYGGPLEEHGATIEPLSDGSFVIVAETRSFVLLPDPYRLWILRLDPAGNITQQYRGDVVASFRRARVRALRDGGWIIGATVLQPSRGGDWWLGRFEADGDLAWTQRLARPRERGYLHDIAEAADGTLLVSGTTGDGGSDSISDDGWIVRLDPSGGVIWQRAYDPGGDFGVLTRVHDLGAAGLIAGGLATPSGDPHHWALRLDGVGDVLWQRMYADSTNNSAILPLASGFAIAGLTYSFGAGDRDGVVMRIDDAGNLVRQHAVGGILDDGMYWLVGATDGGYLAAGYASSIGAGNRDILLLRYDALDNLGASCDFISDSGLVTVESMPVVYDTDAVVTPTTTVFTPTNGVRTPTNGVTTLLCEGAPLDCDDAVASPPLLWPPDHRMIPVEVSSPSLEASGASIVITGVRSDEPVDDRGDGSFAPDAVLQGGSIVLLRAERDGRGNGRVYTIDFTGTDASGGSCDGSVTVGVPKSQGRRMGPIDDGPLFDATEGALRHGARRSGSRR